jgi:hypothetical protein
MIKACHFFLVPSQSSKTPLYQLRTREHALTLCSSVVFNLGFTFESLKELGVHQNVISMWASWRGTKYTIRGKVVATPLWDKCEGEAHTPKSGKLESPETPENSNLDFRHQISSHYSVLYVIEKVLKCRCLKWPRTSHLDICSLSYGQKKGRESNWQLDSRPLKVDNQPLPDVYSRSATRLWKALDESYNFGWNLVPVQAWGEKLWMPKVPGVQTGTISGLHFGSPGKKSHLDVASARSYKEYYKGEGGGFPRVRAVVSQVSLSRPWLVPTPKKGAEWILTNLWLVLDAGPTN